MRMLKWVRGDLGFWFILAVGIAAIFSLPFAAYAADAAPASTFDLGAIFVQVQPFLVDVVVGLIGIVLLWGAKLLKDKTGWDIEASIRSIEDSHRDALQSAVSTALAGALQKFGPALELKIGSPVLAYIIDAVGKAVPDAVSALEPTEQWFLNFVARQLGVTPPPAGTVPTPASTP